MWANPQETVDLVTFTEEILNGKLHFLCFNKFANNARLFMTSLFMTFQRFINSPEIPKSIT